MSRLGSETQTRHLQSAVRKFSMRETVWMHPICLVFKLELFGQDRMWKFDDKALLEFGERILEDLRQGKHRHADIQTPWGDTYNSIPSEVSMKRMQGFIMALRTSWEFWSQTGRQVEQWSQQLDDETRGYLRAFLSGTVEFDSDTISKLRTYMEFLHGLFTSSRAALLLCMARVEFLLNVAPWGDIAPQDYDTLRLRAFQALTNICLAWHTLMRSSWTVACWARSACDALQEHKCLHGSAPDDGHRYNYPADMIDAGEQAHFADTQYSNVESFRKLREDEVRVFFLDCPAGRELFDDCYSIDYWVRTHAQMAKTMSNFRSVNEERPFTSPSSKTRPQRRCPKMMPGRVQFSSGHL
ncbi:hypothetical protein INS49_008151 [Diaporthe citri]|uniref:uncharacterized protein n=1 Tax=Diaporthe citri TaxID=83186 RepID=UPI001C7F24ED|nr:uncharacterized protein INS49_008151 [Diaporthe citri]KAG6363056.1 hypothetical protein INS49_008151 [Diaporthe citri]